MKTLFAYDSFGDFPIFFFELEGDYRHLDKVYINDYNDVEDRQGVLAALILDNECNLKPEIKKLQEPTRDWDFFVRVGFIP
jgi:hypothetical protein